MIVCPAFPATGRTVYLSHLFVGDRLLSESGMENHPLTPMTDPDLRRFLGLQVRTPVGHLPHSEIATGRVREGLLNEAREGRQIVVCDAISNSDLVALGNAARDFPLLTGGSGIALALPSAHGADRRNPAPWSGVPGPALARQGPARRPPGGRLPNTPATDSRNAGSG